MKLERGILKMNKSVMSFEKKYKKWTEDFKGRNLKSFTKCNIKKMVSIMLL